MIAALGNYLIVDNHRRPRIGALLGTALLAHERRARHVLIDRELRHAAPLRLGALAAALYMASMGSTYYLLTLLFQLVASRSALETGLAFLPLTLSVTLAGPFAHRAMQRLPQTHVLAGGFVLGATGLLGLSLTAAPTRDHGPGRDRHRARQRPRLPSLAPSRQAARAWRSPGRARLVPVSPWST